MATLLKHIAVFSCCILQLCGTVHTPYKITIVFNWKGYPNLSKIFAERNKIFLHREVIRKISVWSLRFLSHQSLDFIYRTRHICQQLHAFGRHHYVVFDMDLETSTKVNSFHLKQLKVKSMSQKIKNTQTRKHSLSTCFVGREDWMQECWEGCLNPSSYPIFSPHKKVNNDWVRVCKTPSYNEWLSLKNTSPLQHSIIGLRLLGWRNTPSQDFLVPPR